MSDIRLSNGKCAKAIWEQIQEKDAAFHIECKACLAQLKEASDFEHAPEGDALVALIECLAIVTPPPLEELKDWPKSITDLHKKFQEEEFKHLRKDILTGSHYVDEEYGNSLINPKDPCDLGPPDSPEEQGPLMQKEHLKQQVPADPKPNQLSAASESETTPTTPSRPLQRQSNRRQRASKPWKPDPADPMSRSTGRNGPVCIFKGKGKRHFPAQNHPTILR